MQAQRVLGSPSQRQGNKPIELKDLDQCHRLLTDRCSFWAPVGPHSVPAPSMSQQDQEICSASFSLTLWVGPCGPSRCPQPLCSYCLDLESLLLQGCPESPRISRKTPLPRFGSSSCSQLPRVGSGQVSDQVVRRIRREAGRWKLVIGTFLWPGTSLSFPWCFLPLGGAPLHTPRPHYKCSCSSVVDQSQKGRGQNAES